MMTLPLLATLLVVTAAPPSDRTLLVVPYQTVGVEPETVARFSQALRTAARWRLPGTSSEQWLRSAALCGEDKACLGTLGKQTQADAVLAWSFGKVGASYLFTALLVESSSNRELARFTDSLASLPVDASPLAERAVAELLKVDVAPLRPAGPSERTLLGPTIATASVAGAATISGVIFSILAATNFQTLRTTPESGRVIIERQQRTYNLGADASIGLAVVSAATALILFILGAPAVAP